MSEVRAVVALPHGRTPPHNLDAERSLLGGILLDSSAGAADALKAAGSLTAEDFYREAHRHVFEAMLALDADGAPICRVAVKDEMQRRGTLAAAGEEFIDALDLHTPTAANLSYYAKIIQEKALARRLIEAAQGIAQFGFEQHGDVREFAQRSLEQMTAAVDFGKMGGGWGLEWIEDFLAREFPPAEWLYLDLIPRRSTCVTIAAPTTGKTLLAFDVAAEVVRAAVGQGLRVVIIEEEGTGEALQTRLKRAFAAAGVSPKRSVRVAWNSGRDLVSSADLASLAAECAGVDLIVLDSLADLSSVDENDPHEMKQLALALRKLQRLTGATVYAQHHTTKEAWKPGEAPNLRHLRGHGGLAGKVDTVLALTPCEPEPGRVAFDLYCLKQRDGERAQPRRVTVCMTGPAATVDMQPIPSKQKKVNEAEDDDTAPLRSKALLLLTQKPDSGSGLARRMHANKALVLQLCADLEADGAIEQVNKLWTVVPEPVPAVPEPGAR